MHIIKWIFFDIGSTLVDESIAVFKRVERTVANKNVGFDDFYNKMVDISKHDQNAYHKTLEYYGLKSAPWNSDDEFVYPEAETCLRELHKRYKIGIIANQVPGSRERLEKFGLLKYIDMVVASAEEGVSKPDLRIFRIALDRADCKAEETVMVGDRIDNDILPANRLGMTTIWIKQGLGGLCEPTSKEEMPDCTISELSELAHIKYLTSAP